MKEYLMLFWNESGDGQYQIDPEKMKAGMEAWKAWIGKIAMSGNLISTKPINYDGVMIGHDSKQKQPTILDGKMVTGYLLCKAGSAEEVVGWAKDCPILSAPSGFTEIREVSPFEI